MIVDIADLELIISIVTIAGMVWMVFGFLYKVKQGIEEIPVLKEGIKEVKEDIKEAKKEMEEIPDMKRELKELKNYHELNYLSNVAILNRDYFDIRSPQTINTAGQKLIKETGIGKIVDENEEYIYTQVKQENPSNAYMAQKTVILTVTRIVEEKYKDKMGDAAYNNGRTPHEIAHVGALYIMKRILKKLDLDTS